MSATGFLQSRSFRTFPQFDDVHFTLQNSSLGQIPTILNPRSTASLTWQDKRHGKYEVTTRDMQFLNMSLHKNASPLFSTSQFIHTNLWKIIRNLLALCHYFAFKHPAGPRTTRLHDDLQIPISYEVKAASWTSWSWVSLLSDYVVFESIGCSMVLPFAYV